MATTRTLSVHLENLLGANVEGVELTLKLENDEQLGAETVIISETSTSSDASGDASFTVLPNGIGSQNTSYRMIGRLNTVEVLNVTFKMPDNDADLHDLIASPSAATRTTYADPVTFSDTATFATDVTFSGGTVDFTNATVSGLDTFVPGDYDGNGLIVTGGELAVGAGTGITVNADDVEVDASVVALLGGTNTFTGTVDLTNATVSLNSSDVSHDNTTGYVAAEHIDWTSDQGATNIADANIAASSVTQHETSIDHDALANFVADEHVAHSGVTLTAGAGLTGGGDISASRSFAVGAGTGITVNADDVEVDASVVALLDGTNTFIGTVDLAGATLPSSLNVGDGTTGKGVFGVFPRNGGIVFNGSSRLTFENGQSKFDGVLGVNGGAPQIASDGNDVLALRRSTNAQELRVYGSYTDASNYERISIGYGTSSFEITAESAGTGTHRPLSLQTTDSIGIVFRFGPSANHNFQLSSAQQYFGPTQWDGQMDLGISSGAYRWRSAYLGSNSSIDTSTPAIDITQTWDEGTGTETFTAFLMDITDTASEADSLLMDLQINSSSVFNVNKSGHATFVDGGDVNNPFISNTETGFKMFRDGSNIVTFGNAAANYALTLTGSNFQVRHGDLALRGDDLGITFGSGSDVRLTRDAAQTLALRDGANPNTLNIYGTYTDASNNELVSIGHNGTNAFIDVTSSGTGSDRDLVITTAGNVDVETSNTTAALNVTSSANSSTSGIYLSAKNGGGTEGTASLVVKPNTGELDLTFSGGKVLTFSSFAGTPKISTSGTLYLKGSATSIESNGGGRIEIAGNEFRVRSGSVNLGQLSGSSNWAFENLLLNGSMYAFGSVTDDSNYERISISHDGSEAIIASEAAGTGTARDIVITSAQTTNFRNGTTSQVIAQYNTYENGGTDYERARFWFDGTNFNIETNADGTGAAHDIRIRAGGQDRITATTGGVITLTATEVVPDTDDLSDLGSASSAWASITGYKFQTATKTFSTSDPAIDITQTWYDSASSEVFTAFKMNITDSASSASSALMDLQVDSSSVFNVRKDGRPEFSGNVYISTETLGTVEFYQANNDNFQFGYKSNGFVSSSFFGIKSSNASNPAARIYSDANYQFDLRNSTNSHMLNIYGTWTDASNYERLEISHDGANSIINSTSAGTGTDRQYQFQIGGTTVFQTRFSNRLEADRISSINAASTMQLCSNMGSLTNNFFSCGMPNSGNAWGTVGSKTFYAGLTYETVTTNRPLYQGVQKWGDSSEDFTAFLLNITDNGSADSSSLMDLQINSSSVFNVNKDGAVSSVKSVETPVVILKETPQTNIEATGTKTSALLAADSDVVPLDLLYLDSSGQWDEANATSTAGSLGLLSLALDSSVGGSPLEVAMPNSIVRYDSWSWTPGSQLYVATTDGSITDSAPSATGNVIRAVGYAMTATQIWFQPSTDYGVI